MQSEEATEQVVDPVELERKRCADLCARYLQSTLVDFRARVDKAKGEMRALWDIRAPPAKGKGKGKTKKK